jgi:hypothetical protein
MFAPSFLDEVREKYPGNLRMVDLSPTYLEGQWDSQTVEHNYAIAAHDIESRVGKVDVVLAIAGDAQVSFLYILTLSALLMCACKTTHATPSKCHSCKSACKSRIALSTHCSSSRCSTASSNAATRPAGQSLSSFRLSTATQAMSCRLSMVSQMSTRVGVTNPTRFNSADSCKEVIELIVRRIHLDYYNIIAFPVVFVKGSAYTECAEGMLKVVDAATMETHGGKIFTHEGKQLPSSW